MDRSGISRNNTFRLIEQYFIFGNSLFIYQREKRKIISRDTVYLCTVEF